MSYSQKEIHDIEDYTYDQKRQFLSSVVYSMSVLYTPITLLILILIPLGNIFAQNKQVTDSLEVKQILVDDKERLEILNTLSGSYLRNQPDKAIQKAKEAIKLSKKLNDQKAETRALRHLALGYQNLTANSDTAIHLCYKALKIDQETNNEYGEIDTYLTMANIYRDIGNQFKTLDFLSKAEVIATKLNAEYKLAEILLEKGSSFIEIDHIPEALEVYKKAFKKAKLHDYTDILGKCHLALGKYYHQFGDPKMAKEHFDKALKIYQDGKDKNYQAQAYHLQGKWYLDKDSIEAALSFYEKALEIRQTINDEIGVAESQLQIGKSHLLANRYQKAIVHLNKSLLLASRKNSKQLLRKCYDHLYHAHTSIGDLDKAMEYRDKYSAISELIYTEESEREMAELITKIELDKKEQQLAFERERLANKEAQLRKEHKLNIALIIISVLVLAGASYVLYNYRDKQKMNKKLKEINKKVTRQNKELKELNATKDKFFSIIGHDLKGPLNSLSSFSNLLINHTASLSKEEIKSTAVDLDKTLKNVYGLLTNLLTWARAQTGNIEISPKPINLNKLVEDNFTLQEKPAQNKNIKLQLNADANIQAHADENTINTVLRNLISNAIKFTHDHGTVEVNINEWKDAVEISVKDNGVGMSKEVKEKLFKIEEKNSAKGTNDEKGTGLGLIICKEFVEKNGGEIFVDSKEGEGSTFYFTLPKVATHRSNKPSEENAAV